jgi:hypothetical protein
MGHLNRLLWLILAGHNGFKVGQVGHCRRGSNTGWACNSILTIRSIVDTVDKVVEEDEPDNELHISKPIVQTRGGREEGERERECTNVGLARPTAGVGLDPLPAWVSGRIFTAGVGLSRPIASVGLWPDLSTGYPRRPWVSILFFLLGLGSFWYFFHFDLLFLFSF